MQKLLTIFFFYFFLITHHLFSQQLTFTSFTSEKGLSQNSGYCMAQDALGYLWMGTQDGLNKFNGKTITTYYKENTTRGKLTDNYIKALYYDTTSNWLWIGTASGLSIYNLCIDSFYNAAHYFPIADTLNGLMIRSITAGRNPYEILVLTFSEGLFICNTKMHSTKQFFQQPGIKNNTNAAVVWDNEIAVVADKKLYRLTDTPTLLLKNPLLDDVRKLYVWQNRLWIASTKNGAMYIADFANPVITLFNSGSKDVGTFAKDKYNNLWIGTRTAGIVIAEPQHFNIIYSFTDAPNQNEWPKKFSLSLFKDRQNNMWAGSSGGGFSVNNSTKKEFGLIQKSEPQYGKAAHNMILGIYKPAGNLLYAGTQLEGLRIYDLKAGNMKTASNPDLSSGNSVYSITASSATTIWLATVGGLYHFNTASKKFTHYIDSSFPASTSGQFVYKLKNCDSLLYSSNHGAVFFDTRKKKFQPFQYKDAGGRPLNLVIHKAAEDNKGNLWMGCLGYGLVKYNLYSGAINIIDSIQHFSKIVNAVYYDNEWLWAGTTNGLIVYDPVAGKILQTYSAANGLPGNVIYSIEKDADGNFWCGSNVGLIKIDGQTRKITQVKASAGLQGDEFNTGCSAKDSAGNLYFGGINGISFFNPAGFSVDQFSPQPLIESIKIANREFSLSQGIHYTDTVQLKYFQNFITLEFAVNNFINHEECLYKYRLEGADADWVFAGNRSYVNYSGLKPGRYIFNLQSCNSNGIWSSNITRLVITISPAWWQTWWFILLGILAAVTVLIFITRRRIKDIRYRAETKQKITETEMAALKAQMNPHFMFNCINSIDAFIHSNDKYNATMYLNKFAKLLRNILDSSKQNTVVLSKDVDTLKLYIELEQLRHENKFTSHLQVEDELLNSDYKVPPLIVQPFVENAILHGLKNKTTNDGVLDINIKKEGDKIKYIIRDNGIGRAAAKIIAQSKESSYGMDISTDRIKLFNKETTASIEINDLYENGQATGTIIIVYLKPT